MTDRQIHFCAWPGCGKLTRERWCPDHAEIGKKQDREREQARQQRQLEAARVRDRRRGSARQRGYDKRWEKYARWFLRQPGHQLCALRLDEGCTRVATCVDHIDPPDSRDDPRFWDYTNHQPACIHCNSVKGHRDLAGQFGDGDAWG